MQWLLICGFAVGYRIARFEEKNRTFEENIHIWGIFVRGTQWAFGEVARCCKPFKILLQKQWQVLAVYRGFSCLVVRKSRCRRGGGGSAQMTFSGRRHRFPLRGSIGAFRAMYYIAIARTLPVLAVRRVQATPRTLWGKSPQGTCPFYGNRHCYPFQRPRIPRPPARNPAPAKNPRSVRKKLRSGGEVPIVFGIFI